MDRQVIIAGGGLVPDDLTLASGDTMAGLPRAAAPEVAFAQRDGGGLDIRVRNATSPYYLVIGQNFTPSWHASIGDTDLGRPLLLDGYSAGWRVSKSGSYTITVRYGPQRVYTLALGVTGMALAVALAAVWGIPWPIRRRRQRDAT